MLHIVYSYDPEGNGTGDVVNVYYRRSTDNGATWGTEVQINDDATLTDQYQPSLSVGEGNVVAVGYYSKTFKITGEIEAMRQSFQIYNQ